MSNIRLTKGTLSITPGRIFTIILWVLQIVLAIQFILSGFLKLGGSPAMVSMFTEIGAGQWLRYLVGVIEVAGAIGLLIPRLSGLAALALLCLLIGATVTNLFILGTSPWIPLIFLLLCALIAWGRWSQTSALLSSLKH